jgi:hypothetical protein
MSRQEFRAHQRNEFLAAVAAAAGDPEMLLSIETDEGGNTVAIIHKGPLADEVQAPAAPINPLCRADNAEDVIYMARQAVAFVKNVQDTQEGVFYVLSMVGDALEFANQLQEHQQAARRSSRKAVQS